MSVERKVPERLIWVQALRFLAAMIVVYHHQRTQATFFDGNSDFRTFTLGFVGVDVFFVISGFIMVYVSHGRDIAPPLFILRRFLRVWPLYAVATAIATFLVFFYPSYFYGSADLSYAIKSAFFIPEIRPIDAPRGNVWPLIVPGWTLNVEVLFYCMFGLCLFLRQSTVAVFIAMTSLYFISTYFDGVYPWASLYSKDGAVILEFLLGVVIGCVYLSRNVISGPVAIWLLALGLFTIFSDGQTGARFIDRGLPAALIVFGAVSLSVKPPQPVATAIDFGGNISYSIYLSHIFVISSLTQYLKTEGYNSGSISGVYYSTSILAVSAAVGILVHLYIERPIARRLTEPFLRSLAARLAHRVTSRVDKLLQPS